MNVAVPVAWFSARQSSFRSICPSLVLRVLIWLFLTFFRFRSPLFLFYKVWVCPIFKNKFRFIYFFIFSCKSFRFELFFLKEKDIIRDLILYYFHMTTLIMMFFLLFGISSHFGLKFVAFQFELISFSGLVRVWLYKHYFPFSINFQMEHSDWFNMTFLFN